MDDNTVRLSVKLGDFSFESVGEQYLPCSTVDGFFRVVEKMVEQADRPVPSDGLPEIEKLGTSDIERRNMVIEVCAECGEEIEMAWDTDTDGYMAFCPHCGSVLMLCNECKSQIDNAETCKCDFGLCPHIEEWITGRKPEEKGAYMTVIEYPLDDGRILRKKAVRYLADPGIMTDKMLQGEDASEMHWTRADESKPNERVVAWSDVPYLNGLYWGDVKPGVVYTEKE